MPFLAENKVLQLYENNKTNQSIWALGFSNWKDFFTKDGGEANGDGINTSITAGDDIIRMNVTSIPVSKIEEDGNGNFNKGLENATKDLAQALDRGFLYSSKDFRNVEVTGYAKVLRESTKKENMGIVWFGPSGRHPIRRKVDDQHKEGCWGSTYKTNYWTSKNKLRISKEGWHVKYDHRQFKKVDDSFKDLKKNGLKHVSFIFERNGKLGRHIEAWIDLQGIDTTTNKPKNKWKLVRVEEDHPDLLDSQGHSRHWGKEMRLCNCTSDSQIILWAAPLATYRWDYSRIELSHATVQEINPPEDGNFHQLGTVIEP
jgi:hypothetical protein